MTFSDRLDDLGADTWGALKDNPFVRMLAVGRRDETAFQPVLKHGHPYLLDYVRLGFHPPMRRPGTRTTVDLKVAFFEMPYISRAEESDVDDRAGSP